MTLRITRRRDRYAIGPYILFGRRSLGVRVACVVLTLTWRSCR